MNPGVKGKHFASVSLLRILAFLAVFAFHVFYFGSPIASYPWAYLFSGAVQSFFFLSGLLYSQKDCRGRGFLVKEGNKLFVPCAEYLVLLILVDLAFLSGAKESLSFLNFKMILGNASPSGVYNVQFGNLWFLPALFGCYCFTPLVQKFADRGLKTLKNAMLGEALAELLIVYFLHWPTVGIPYLLGYYFGRKDFAGILEPSEKRKPLYFLWPWLAFLLLVGVDTALNLNPGRLSDWLLSFGEIARAYVGAFFALGFLRAFRFLNERNEPRIIGYLGGLVYWLYLVHETFMCGVTNCLSLSPSLGLGALIVLGFTLLFAVLLSEGHRYLDGFQKAAKNGGRPIPL
jgi:fucose 4-O-acetylase-like acetyltransferase